MGALAYPLLLPRQQYIWGIFQETLKISKRQINKKIPKVRKIYKKGVDGSKTTWYYMEAVAGRERCRTELFDAGEAFEPRRKTNEKSA